MRMSWIIRFSLSVFAIALLVQPVARAQISASATYTPQQLGPNLWRYSLTLNNNGSTNIGTLWFGWIVYPPIYDLLPNVPTNVQAPSGWSGAGLNDSIYGGYSVEWTTAGSPLAAHSSLSGFSFDSPDPPSLMTSTSPVFPIVRSDTSWVYIGASQGDPGFQFTPVQNLPEPASAALLALPTLALLRRRRR